MEQARVCRVCGHAVPPDESLGCSNCWSFSGFITVAVDRSWRGRIRRLWLRLLRRRYLIAGLALGLIVWRLVVFLDLGPLIIRPPQPVTSVNADAGPLAWAQARRSAENTGFTPQRPPAPQTIKWTYATSKPLAAAPAVAGDRVYLATEDGRTIALDGESGGLVWEYRSGSPSSSTPAVAGDVVVSAVPAEAREAELGWLAVVPEQSAVSSACCRFYSRFATHRPVSTPKSGPWHCWKPAWMRA